MLSIIIPTKGRSDSLVRCLTAIIHETATPFEIILVNYDYDGLVVHDLPNSRVLHYPGCSYAFGINRGCEVASGDYFTVPGIANDIEVTKHWDVSLIEALQDQRVGMAVPGVQERSVVDGPVYGAFISPPAFNLDWNQMPEYAGYGVVRRDVFQNVGLMDENFTPIYLEDVDYGLRVLTAGYTIKPCRESLIIHHHELEGRTYVNQANKEYFYKKWNIQI
jgi:GT2 family glycosyltransferase